MDIKPEDRKRDPTLTKIQKVGAAIVKDKKILAVRKLTEDRPEYYMAGGRMEGDETQKETLERELLEELGVKVISQEYIGSFEDIAVFEETPIVIHAYLVEIEGEPVASSEIKEYAWLDCDFETKGIQVGSILRKGVIPALVTRGIM